jgi:hypothetical protein
MVEMVPILHGIFGNSEVVTAFRLFVDLHTMLRSKVFAEEDLNAIDEKVVR